MSDLKNKKNKIAKKIQRNTEKYTENNIHCNKTKYTYKRQHTMCDINIICTIYVYTNKI